MLEPNINETKSVTPTEKVNEGEFNFFSQAWPCSSQVQELSLVVSPLVSSKDIQSISLSPELEILEDHMLDQINIHLTSITVSVSALRKIQMTTDLLVDNFRDKILKEVSFLAKNINKLFMKMNILKKDKAESTIAGMLIS